MYEATDRKSTAAEYPAGSHIRESDWHVLAGFWHPVAFSSEVGESPVASRRPHFEDYGPEWLRIQIPKGTWAATASRHCENFNDIAHLSWVHMKTFGNRARPVVPDYTLKQTDYGLYMELPYLEVTPRRRGEPARANP